MESSENIFFESSEILEISEKWHVSLKKKEMYFSLPAESAPVVESSALIVATFGGDTIFLDSSY